MSAPVSSRWLTAFRDPPDPGCTLVCLPHAGGGASVFRSWPELSGWLSVRAVRLPGREHRASERALSTMDELVAALAPALGRVLDGDYAFYGHSMGALVAFEVTRALEVAGLPGPRALYLAGCVAPRRRPTRTVYHLPREQLVEWLSDGNGLDPEVLRYPGLVDFMLTTIRADLSVVDTYRYRPAGRIDVPVRVFCGADDPQMPVEDCRAWEEETSGPFEAHVLPGGHFFVNDHAPRIVELIEADLRDRSEVTRP